MDSNNFDFKIIDPNDSLSDFVYCFSSLQNLSTVKEAVIIPNGKIDLIFTKTTDNQLKAFLMGLENKPKSARLDVPNFFAVSFNPLAIEYIFQQSIADILNIGKAMTNNFWDFNIDDLNDFDAFCEKATNKIRSFLPVEIDGRKRKLFALIFATNGEISIKNLAEQTCWSERQINRYFNQQFGLSIKAYCNILRFQASLPHIKQGRLFPQLNYTDQSHFIKEIKKLSGVSPKELFKNENDRFLQFLVYDKP
jgi:AraC-like DNA-binding protein